MPLRSHAIAAGLALSGLVACKASSAKATAQVLEDARRDVAVDAPSEGGVGVAVEARVDAIDASLGGCRRNDACPADQLCVFERGLCGKGSGPRARGACRPRPRSCEADTAPVCGCDGRVYEGACAARAAGVDVSVTGGCAERRPGFAPCGKQYCDVRTSYCEIFLSDVVDPPSDYFCRPLPAACRTDGGAAATCDCFPAGTRCGSFCGPLSTAPGGPVGFHLTCQGTRPPTE